MTAEELLNMDADAFHGIVNLDLRKGTDDDTWVALRSSQVFERWWGTLIAMSKSIDSQLGANREEFLALQSGIKSTINAALLEARRAEDELNKLTTSYHKTRTGALRFKGGLEEWLAEAASIRRQRKAATKAGTP